MGPGAHPHPPQTPKGRIHGAALLATSIAFLLATPTHAQIIPTGSPAADILLSQAIAEQRIFLTCSALDLQTHTRITETWQRDTAAAVAILNAANVPPEAITAFTAAADPAALMPTDDIPWAAVKALCDSQPDWQDRHAQADYIVLDQTLPKAFE
jgi:hypothetical protein